jgi:hypothetical protein
MKNLLVLIFVFAFIVETSNTALLPPQLLLPDQYQNRISTSQVEFFWTSVDSATKYILILSDDPNFKTSPILFSTTSDTFLLANVQLDSGRTYFWRVASTNGMDTSQTSQRFIFTTTFPKIHVPLIISPKNDTIHHPNAKLEWELDKFATKAMLHYSEDSLFNIVIQIDLQNKGYYDHYNTIMNGNKYYWRVIVGNPDTTTVWSETGWFKYDLWKGPEIEYPLYGDTNVSLQPKVLWHSIDSASVYNVLLYDDDSLKNVIFKTTLKDTAIKLSLILEYEKHYTLKLYAQVQNGNTINSIIKFRTIAPPEPFTKSIMLIYPDSVKPVTNPKPAFRWNSEPNADSYELWVSDTSKIEDATRVKLNVDEYKDTVYTLSTTSLRPNKDYYWRVRGINLSGKGQWSDVWMFRTSNFSDVEEVSKQFDFTISPNPASDFIEISVGANGRSPLQSVVKIYNVFGQNVMTVGAIHELPQRVDISGLSPGMYFVRIGDRVGKFVKY